MSKDFDVSFIDAFVPIIRLVSSCLQLSLDVLEHAVNAKLSRITCVLSTSELFYFFIGVSFKYVFLQARIFND